MNAFDPKYTAPVPPSNSPSRQVSTFFQLGRQAARGVSQVCGLSAANQASSGAVSTTGTAQRARLSSQLECARGSTSGRVNEALRVSPTRRPLT